MVIEEDDRCLITARSTSFRGKEYAHNRGRTAGSRDFYAVHAAAM
jgi:hypothetical protein